MERKIGEIFTYGDKRYQVVKVNIGTGCIGCAFETSGCSKYKSFLGHCFHIFRRDNTSVIFKLINNNNIWDKDKSEIMSDYINIRCNIDSTFYKGFHNNVLLDSISYMYNE